jgi:nicotinate-nucleotide pyrophosphorylase (carboxylating)
LINYPQYKDLPENYIKSKIQEFLQEDCPKGDITTELTIHQDEVAKAIISTEEETVFVGEKVLPFFFDENFNFKLFFKDGAKLKRGSIIAEVTGKAQAILKIERTLLNLLQRMCGIAAQVKQFTEVADKFNVRILDTRKTVPGLRLFDKYAVAAAGGYNHRLDLSSGILIKDNHLSNKDLRYLLVNVKNKNTSNLPIELEVDNFEQLAIGLEIGVDGFLLDNLEPGKVKDAVALIRNSTNGNQIFIEASGGINLINFEAYLNTGIDAISIGSLTHSVKSANIHIEFKRL